MGNCLCCCDNKARQVELDLENSLRAVASVFPGTHYCVIVTPGGDTRAYVSASESAAEQTLEVISSLKLAALHFVQSFGQAKCPVIHVRGTHNMFSCYNVGENVLAFNSVMTARQLAEFSVSDADEEMGRLIRDIEVLVAEQQRLASR